MKLFTPPQYCEYVNGECDQEFSKSPLKNVFFAYPANPQIIAATIETAVNGLRSTNRKWNWISWTMLPIPGQIIFCEICKAARNSASVVCDVTTLNFNVLFELGFVIGLGLPVLPIRDTSFQINQRTFDSLGLLDTVGYIDFTNSDNLRKQLVSRLPGVALPEPESRISRETPLYVLKGPIETEGALQLSSTLKMSPLGFRSYDPVETPRLSLHEARRQVAASVGVIANLLHPSRGEAATAHNGQCAIICGMAMAQQKIVVMLQEEGALQPIDYRDVVKSYRNPNMIANLLAPSLRSVIDALHSTSTVRESQSGSLLSEANLGDVAAENEVVGLHSYFVSTGPAVQARRGHARLVVGRKGSGKTAIFYDVRERAGRGNDRLVLDLKPEGHQFKRLKDSLLERMGTAPGLREHTMVAFWNYILLCELARAALDKDRSTARIDPLRYERYARLARVYDRHDQGWNADFSQRLVRQVDGITSKLQASDAQEIGASLTELIYKGDVRELNDAVSDYLRSKESVWVLVDNLDKGWPVRGTTETDMLIVRSLLDATRKLQHQLEANDIELKCLVFLRSDIYEHLRNEMPDKGKDTALQLDWEDPELFKEIVRLRIANSAATKEDFAEIWPLICDPLVGAQDSFSYFVERTLMRPRDLLQFLNRAIDVATNRGHDRVLAEDIVQAEKSYSEDILLATMFEILDTHPEYQDILYVFQGAPSSMSLYEALGRIQGGGFVADDSVIELLIWFGFLGVSSPTFPDVKYSYSVQANIRRLVYPLKSPDGMLVVHPAFRAALDIQLVEL